MWRKKKKTSEGILWRFIWIISLVIAFFLIIAMVSPLIAPDRFCLAAFFGLAYPFFAIFTFIFIIIIAFKNLKKALLLIIILISGISILRHSFSFINHKEVFDSNESELTLMSYNVHLFDLYSWKDPGKTKDSIIDLVHKIKPHVLCMQEFYKDTSKAFDTENDFMRRNHFKYSYTNYFQIKYNVYHFGMAIFSSYPIINKGEVKSNDDKSNGNYVIYADILVNKDTLRIYSAHLQSIKLSPQDEELFKSENELSQDKLREKSTHLLRKLKAAFIDRAKQVRKIRKHIDECPYTYFICGDFNDTPVSYAYRLMRANHNDAFLDAGHFGFGKTYRGAYPSFRIDYILYPDEYEASGFKVIEKDFSDHYPVYCNFRKKK